MGNSKLHNSSLIRGIARVVNLFGGAAPRVAEFVVATGFAASAPLPKSRCCFGIGPPARRKAVSVRRNAYKAIHVVANGIGSTGSRKVVGRRLVASATDPSHPSREGLPGLLLMRLSVHRRVPAIPDHVVAGRVQLTAPRGTAGPFSREEHRSFAV